MLRHITGSILNSYSQVFFSNNRYFALLLMLASFTDPAVGLSGLLSVVVAILCARAFGLAPAEISSGIFSFNALLSGFAMGACFQFNVFIVFAASLLTLLFSIWISAIAVRHRLPFLSLPFVLATWVLFLNSGAMHCQFAVRPLPGLVPGFMQEISVQAELLLPAQAGLYLKSLSAVFFQNNLLSGILIAIGLLVYSRIAFSLSLLGYFSGFLYFSYVYGDPDPADYYYMAFNYMLTYIAIGGFFLLPSKSSYLLAFLLTPLIGLLTGALQLLVVYIHLPLYSLPFSIVTIIVISALNHRYSHRYFQLAIFQLYSPEKNLYAAGSYRERFKNDSPIDIHLPFFGEWTVSQGHEGDLTHRQEWSKAWDFVVTDEQRRTFRLPGKKPQDFYCYALPVLAPADGTVVALEDGIEDNGIGDVNLVENWGNTLVIQHAGHLYSKLSHLKKGSFKVKEGDTVKKGELLALCGSSGRSPEPHIHFQLQDAPYIGAKTIHYPISYYVSRKGDRYELHAFDVPAQDEVILRTGSSSLMKQSFNLVPGKKMSFEVSGQGPAYTVSWRVMADEHSNTWLLCERSGAKAYFTNNDTLFYFTAFAGDKSALLYYFYLGAYKLLLSYFPDLEITDKLPVEDTYKGIRKYAQDFLAPFYIYLKPVYKSTYKHANDKQDPSCLTISSGILSAGPANKELKIEIALADQEIKQITILENDLCVTAICRH